VSGGQQGKKAFNSRHSYIDRSGREKIESKGWTTGASVESQELWRQWDNKAAFSCDSSQHCVGSKRNLYQRAHCETSTAVFNGITSTWNPADLVPGPFLS